MNVLRTEGRIDNGPSLFDLRLFAIQLTPRFPFYFAFKVRDEVILHLADGYVETTNICRDP
jgi:hypothetical protein